MAKPKEDYGQDGGSGWTVSPLATRQQLSPMPADEDEAFHYALQKLSELDPEADVRELVEEGIDAQWFIVDEQGMLHVNPEAPDA